MAEEINVGMKCIKYMLFVANFMFVMIGFLLILIGSAIKAIYGEFELFMETHYFSPAILSITVGVIIFFVALFGCIGAIKESTCLINLFGFFLTLLLILEVAAAIAAYAMRSNIESAIREKMTLAMKEYLPYERNIWDITQSSLHCCGIDAPDDWVNYGTYKNTTTDTTTVSTTVSAATETTTVNSFERLDAPTSCCNQRYVNYGYCTKQYSYNRGCLKELTYFVSESALLLGCGALAVAFIQLLGIIFAWMLAKAVRRLKTQQLLDREQTRQRAYEQLSKNKENSTPVLYTPTFSEA